MAQLFYIFCTTLPSHIIPFTLFWNFQWRSRKAALVLVAFNVLCKMTTAAYYQANGLYFRNLELLFAVVGFLIYCLFLRLSPFKMLFTYLLIVDYLLIVRGVVSIFAVQVFDIPIQGWGSSFVCILLYSVTLPLLLRFFRQVANRVYRTDAPGLWRTIWLVPAFVTVLALTFTDSYLESSVDSSFFIFCRIGLLVCVFAIYFVLLQSMEGLEQQAALRQRLIFESRLLDMQLEEEEKRGLLLMETAEQTRQMRHDLRHHLTAIQAMARDDNPRLSEYIAALIRDIPTAVQDYCENPTVNAVVSHYAACCQKEGIAFAVRLTVPAQNEGLDDRALCIVFANLLENAVEACGRIAEGEKFIRLSSRLEHGVLTITMDNSFDGKFAKQKEKFLSSKRSGFGIGISSIQAVAKAHQGDARFEAEGTVFRSSVYCRLQIN